MGNTGGASVIDSNGIGVGVPRKAGLLLEFSAHAHSLGDGYLFVMGEYFVMGGGETSPCHSPVVTV